MNAKEYAKPLEDLFFTNSNKENAMAMAKYMRNKFDYYGIKSPLRKELMREFLKSSGNIPDEIKNDVIIYLWNVPQRECQYVAMELLDRTAKKENVNIISLYEKMILEKSWWDTIDFIAGKLLATYFTNYPEKITEKTSMWMKSGNIWLQRCCLLFQLKYKKNTNTVLLESFIVKLTDSKEFFIQKAIGWILREYSKTNPSYVIEFVKNNKLAPLSKREALLWMDRNNHNKN